MIMHSELCQFVVGAVGVVFFLDLGVCESGVSVGGGRKRLLPLVARTRPRPGPRGLGLQVREKSLILFIPG